MHPGIGQQPHPGAPQQPQQPHPGAPQQAQLAPPPILLKGDPDPRLVLVIEPDSARAASFRVLRDNLLAKRLPRVVAVSSAGKTDGKTTCAVNLALSLSEGARVLLLDGNLIDPALGEIFCINDATPASPATAGWLAPYRIAAFSRGLHVAALVLKRGQPAPRFEKQWFEQLIGSLRRINYDFIIIDAASLSASPTVAHMVAMADGTLLTVRSGITTARALRRAADQIPEAKRIGLALVDAKPTAE
jgi:Mrp family chromosome partitioning ATPase